MKKTRNEVAVGAFVVVGTVILSIMIFFISGVYLFRTGQYVNVLYDYVDILDKGAPVRMAGVRVGEVNSITLYNDEKSQKLRVKVRLFIDGSADIRQNFKFEIRGTHILSEPHIEITPQPGSEPKITNELVLEGVRLEPIEDLIIRAQNIAKNLDDLTGSLRDTFVGDENSAELKNLVRNLAKLSASLQEAADKGDLPKTMENIKVSSEAIREILDNMKKGEGTVGGLLVKDELYKDMKDLMSDVKKHPWKLFKKK